MEGGFPPVIPTGGGIQFDVPNVGGTLFVETTDAGAVVLVSDQGDVDITATLGEIQLVAAGRIIVDGAAGVLIDLPIGAFFAAAVADAGQVRMPAQSLVDPFNLLAEAFYKDPAPRGLAIRLTDIGVITPGFHPAQIILSRPAAAVGGEGEIHVLAPTVRLGFSPSVGAAGQVQADALGVLILGAATVSDKLGFFGTPPVVQQSPATPDAAGIIAALQAYGLFA